MRILLVEDKEEIEEIIRNYLGKETNSRLIASKRDEALQFVTTETFDLVIFNWLKCQKDSMVLCQEIKKLNLPLKMLLLAPKDTTVDELGHLVETFIDTKEISVDTASLVIQFNQSLQPDTYLFYQDITLNSETCEVKKNEEIISLTKKEYDLLHCFMKNINIVLSRDQLLNQVWGMNYDGDVRTVDTHVKRLRRKIGSQYIVTKIGMGYLMEQPKVSSS
ncbi:winged helix-turn-helix transcriptional regulator [Vagococcus carniphilus]|uniref:winged helix-turn-helix transcriptional regulator n=1 Tax=Vagococcus carniphilus TaxID=218144 RepID=UPI003B5A5775